jgi:membrane protein implicated in regulation of membrane protease activity
MRPKNPQIYVALLMVIGAIIAIVMALFFPSNPTVNWIVAIVWIVLAVVAVRRTYQANVPHDK